MRSKRLRDLGWGVVSFASMLVACDDPASSVAASPARSRVEAVGARRSDPAERFCDRSSPEGEGAVFTPPAAIEGAPLFASSGGWRWLNVWASWCGPCVEEMPLLAGWEARLAADGAPIEIGLLSVDAAPEAVAAFRASHPETPDTRLTDPAGLPGLIGALGLDAGATLPIHALIEPSGRLRCVRTGSVAERDYATVREIVEGR